MEDDSKRIGHIGNLDAFRSLCRDILDEPSAENPEMTTVESLIRSIIASGNIKAIQMIFDAAYGRIPNPVQEIAMDAGLTLKVEYDADWKLEVSDDDSETVDAEYRVITDESIGDE